MHQVRERFSFSIWLWMNTFEHMVFGVNIQPAIPMCQSLVPPVAQQLQDKVFICPQDNKVLAWSVMHLMGQGLSTISTITTAATSIIILILIIIIIIIVIIIIIIIIRIS